MNLELWSFVLSVVGVVLGVISAFAQLKSVSLKALRATGDALLRSSERRNARSDFFLASPSALIAFITYRVLGAIFLFAAGTAVFQYKALVLDLPDSISLVVKFAMAGLCSNFLTSAFMVCWQVYRRAVSTYATNKDS